MRRFFYIALILFSFNLSSSENFDWRGLVKRKIDLAYPLLTVKGSKGFLACAYIDSKVCDKTKEACAIVSGVKNHNDMLSRKIIAASKKAIKLGIKIGMTGKEAILLLR